MAHIHVIKILLREFVIGLSNIFHMTLTLEYNFEYHEGLQVLFLLINSENGE